MTKTRPKIGQRLPRNQEWRRQLVVSLTKDANRRLDEALKELGDEAWKAQALIVKAQRAIDKIEQEMNAMQYGAEPRMNEGELAT